MADQTATDSNTEQISRYIPIKINNPVVVTNDEGRILGSAIITFTEGGIQAEIYLDKNCPETFDLDINPERIKQEIWGQICKDALNIEIVLHT